MPETRSETKDRIAVAVAHWDQRWKEAAGQSLNAAKRHNGKLRLFIDQGLDTRVKKTEGVCFGITLNWLVAHMGGDAKMNAFIQAFHFGIQISGQNPEGKRFVPSGYISAQYEYQDIAEDLQKKEIKAQERSKSARRAADYARSTEALHGSSAVDEMKYIERLASINVEIAKLEQAQFNGQLLDQKDHITLKDSFDFISLEAETGYDGSRACTFMIGIFMEEGGHALGMFLPEKYAMHGATSNRPDARDTHPRGTSTCREYEFIDPNLGIFTFEKIEDLRSFYETEILRLYKVTSVKTYEVGCRFAGR